MMDKREIVEAWLSRLCTKLDYMVLNDHEFWPQEFKSQVQAAYDCDLIENLGLGFCWYYPTEEDIEYLYPVASIIMNMVSNEN
jgi:hypothetical protein